MPTNQPVMRRIKVLITGMSGVGKSSVITALAKEGLRAIDLDEDGWSVWVPCTGNPTGAKPGYDWLWHEPKLTDLLADHKEGALFLSGCAPNMGKFRSKFDHVVLLSAPIELLLHRVTERQGNPYGKTAEEARQIAANLKEFEPVLRRASTHEIDASQRLEKVVADVLAAARS